MVHPGRNRMGVVVETDEAYVDGARQTETRHTGKSFDIVGAQLHTGNEIGRIRTNNHGLQNRNRFKTRRA